MGCRWKSQNRKNVYLSPYVEEPLNSKVIKSFVPELRICKCFSCFGIPMFYVYIYIYEHYERFAYRYEYVHFTHIRIWLGYTASSLFWIDLWKPHLCPNWQKGLWFCYFKIWCIFLYNIMQISFNAIVLKWPWITSNVNLTLYSIFRNQHTKIHHKV